MNEQQRRQQGQTNLKRHLLKKTAQMIKKMKKIVASIVHFEMGTILTKTVMMKTGSSVPNTKTGTNNPVQESLEVILDNSSVESTDPKGVIFFHNKVP